MKIKISWLWLFAIPLFPYLHMQKIMLFMFLILSVHECMHMLAAYVFHYRIECVRIYPFGLSATIPELGYGSICREIIIIAAGPLSQVLLPFCFDVFVHFNIISLAFATYLKMVNANIMIFNLLPVYPLDGGRLLQAFFHSILRFKKAQQCTCIASFVILLILFVMQFFQQGMAFFVQLFLFANIVICYKDITHMQLQFYHYRYQHPVHLPLILNRKHDFYRGRYNIIKTNKGWMEEDSWLFQHFTPEVKS